MLERLRAFLVPRRYPIAVVSGIAALTTALLLLTDAMSAEFADQAKAELETRARHGAQELAAIAALGAVVDNAALFNDALDDYVTSPNLRTLAIEAHGKTLVSHGDISGVHWLFDARPNVLLRGPGYVASWARGPAGTKIAVVLSTVKLDHIDALQAVVSYLLLAVGAAGALGFVLVRRWHSPPIVRIREIDAPVVELPVLPAAPVDDGAQRTLQLVLAQASQGFVVVEVATQHLCGRAKIVDRWFGEPGPEATIGSYLGAGDIMATTGLTAGVAQLHEGSTPVAEALAELPARITRDDRTFEASYTPILRGVRAERLLVTLNDITEQLAREAAEREAREQRDVAALAELLTANRSEFDEFYAEVARLMATLETPGDVDTDIGAIRALKDNCGYYGCDSFVELCSKIEASIGETSEPMTDVQRTAIADGWGRIASRLMRISAAAS